MPPPCVLSSGYALGGARVLRVCKHPHVSACRPTTRSRLRLPMLPARRVLGGSQPRSPYVARASALRFTSGAFA